MDVAAVPALVVVLKVGIVLVGEMRPEAASLMYKILHNIIHQSRKNVAQAADNASTSPPLARRRVAPHPRHCGNRPLACTRPALWLTKSALCWRAAAKSAWVSLPSAERRVRMEASRRASSTALGLKSSGAARAWAALRARPAGAGIGRDSLHLGLKAPLVAQLEAHAQDTELLWDKFNDAFCEVRVQGALLQFLGHW